MKYTESKLSRLVEYRIHNPSRDGMSTLVSLQPFERVPVDEKQLSRF